MNITAFINAAIVGVMAACWWRQQPPVIRETHPART